MKLEAKLWNKSKSAKRALPPSKAMITSILKHYTASLENQRTRTIQNTKIITTSWSPNYKKRNKKSKKESSQELITPMAETRISTTNLICKATKQLRLIRANIIVKLWLSHFHPLAKISETGAWIQNLMGSTPRASSWTVDKVAFLKLMEPQIVWTLATCWEGIRIVRCLKWIIRTCQDLRNVIGLRRSKYGSISTMIDV